MVSVIGCVERITREVISGWACNQQLPSRPVEVHLRHEGRVLARTRASQPREDLASLGHASIDFGFTLALPEGTPLDLTSMEVAVFGSRIPLPVLPDACALEGMVEQVERGFISGWAWRPGYPSERPMISITNGDGAEVAKVCADIPREDLAEAGIGDGAYGFVFDAFALLEAAGVSVRSLNASFIASGTALDNLQDIESPPAAMPEEIPATEPVPEPVRDMSKFYLAPPPESTALSQEAVDAIRNALGGNIGPSQTGLF